MGYGYGYGARGRLVLACDSCGKTGGVRKRTCPYKVTGTSLRSPTRTRWSLPYCPAPALCADCYKNHGGLRGVHGDSCKNGAAAYQARYDAEQARLESGDSQVTTRYGSWAEGVPDGHVKVVYRSLDGRETVKILPKGVSDADWLSEIS